MVGSLSREIVPRVVGADVCSRMWFVIFHICEIIFTKKFAHICVFQYFFVTLQPILNKIEICHQKESVLRN